jgi:hypothetical protein
MTYIHFGGRIHPVRWRNSPKNRLEGGRNHLKKFQRWKDSPFKKAVRCKDSPCKVEEFTCEKIYQKMVVKCH